MQADIMSNNSLKVLNEENTKILFMAIQRHRIHQEAPFKNVWNLHEENNKNQHYRIEN